MSESGSGDPAPKKSVEEVAQETGSYDVQAFYFVFEALEWLMTRLDERRHVTGAELSKAVRDFAVERFGMLAGPVLKSWGLKSTSDVGRIVYALIEAGQMSKTEQDSVHDFDDVYDFDKAFASYDIPAHIEKEDEKG